MEANPSANVKFAIKYVVTAYDSGISHICMSIKGKIDNKHMQAPLLFPQIINMQ